MNSRAFQIVRIVGWLLAIGILTCGCGAKAPPQRPAENGQPAALTVPQSTVSPLSKEDAPFLPDEMKRIYEKGKITVAMYNKDRPPFFFVDANGQLTGTEVEIARDLANQFGVSVEFDRTADTFDEVVRRVAAGKADFALSKLSTTLPRARLVRFSEPYLVLHQALLVNRLKLAGLSNKAEDPFTVIRNAHEQIAVLAGTSYVGFANDLFPSADIVQYPNQTDIMDAAYQGHALAALYDEFEVKTYMKNNPARSIDLQTLILQNRVDPIAVAVAADHPQLLSWINLYLQTNKEEIDGILQKYGVIGK